jgi:hypothetical protein
VSETKRKYDSTVARIAGNLLSGVFRQSDWPQTTERRKEIAADAVKVARAIVEEVQRTEPEAKS